MKSGFFFLSLTVLLFFGFSFADTPIFKTTLADNSRVALTTLTALSRKAVELVFGTSDGCLHCWELGSCSTGYAPWCQFQHDDGRTGVLE
jgi:hypothetical protein